MADKKDQIAAYNKIVEAAEKAGSPDPYLTASIAMLESGWMTSDFAKKNNPFGQTILPSQVGKKGITKGTRAADGLLTAEYDSLDSAMKHHMDKWGEYYVKGNPEQSLKNLVDNSYNVVNPNWASTIYTIHTGPTASEAKREFSLDTEVDNVLDPTAQALGLPTSEDVQTQLQAYNDIKAYEELAASDPSIVVPLPNPNYDPNKSISEQYLEFNPELTEYFQGADNIPLPPSTEQPAVAAAPTEDLQTKEQAYNDLKSYDDAVAAGQADFALANPNYDPDRPQAEQYLDANPDLKNYLQGTTDPSTPPSGSDSLNPPQSLIDEYGDDAYVFWKNMTPEMRADYKPTSDAGDPTSTATGATGRASGYEGMSAGELQNIYQGLLEADAAAAAGDGVYPLISQEFEPGPQAPQFLARRMKPQPGSQEYLDTLLDLENQGGMYRDVYYDQEKDIIENLDNQDISLDKDKDFQNYSAEPEVKDDSVNRNFLSKLKGQDYMGLLSDIGGYAARTAPLQRALRDASSYDEERYPRFAPIIPTATLPKRDVRDAFATAQQAALQQGKLDLGALSALATQQAKETARVEENVANERVGLLNQAQQLNNQVTMQEMADTAANKGAAATMKYQALAAMSEMGQGSLREANMRRNDQIVKNMFSNVFGDEFG